jgi:hypothetical protein
MAAEVTAREVETFFKSEPPAKAPPKGLRPKPKPAAETRRRAAVIEAVFVRDARCLMESVGPCFGRQTPHHRRKAGQGGSFTEDNIVRLCSWHNDELEADAPLARWGERHGFVLRTGDDPASVAPYPGCGIDCPVDHR